MWVPQGSLAGTGSCLRGVVNPRDREKGSYIRIITRAENRLSYGARPLRHWTIDEQPILDICKVT